MKHRPEPDGLRGVAILAYFVLEQRFLRLKDRFGRVRTAIVPMPPPRPTAPTAAAA